MYLFLFILLINTDVCRSFFKNPPLQIDTIQNRQNLTCATDSEEINLYTDCEYCVFEFFNNGTDSTIYHDCIYLTNSYRPLSQRCTGFTNTSDIGYGLCSQLPFEYYDVNLLCICATNLCNTNFTTCKQSVDSNPNVPALPTPVPSLTANSSTFTCEDMPLGLLNSTYYCIRDSSPYINMTQCEEYVQSHTVLCMYTESFDGDHLTLSAIPDEDYEYVLTDLIQSMQRMEVQPNVEQYYNETTNAFYVHWEETIENEVNYTIIYNKCFCTTNDCNVNLTACLQSGIPNISNITVNRANKDTFNVFLIMLIVITMKIDFCFKINF